MSSELVNDSIMPDDVEIANEVLNEEQGEESNEEQSLSTEESSLQEKVEEAIEEGASEEEIKELIKEYKIKVNGKEKVVKLDFNDEKEVVRKLQLAEAGQSAMQKAKQLEKAYQQGLQELVQNPWKVLKDLGLDPDQVLESRLQEKIAEMQKSPEEIEREKMQRELEEARSELKRQKEEAEEAKFSKLKEQESAKLESEIMEALEAHKTLPNHPKTVTRIADAMLWAYENGYNDVSVKDVIPAVEREIELELQSLFDQMPEELLEKFIGKKHIDRLRMKKVNQIKTNSVNNIKPTSESLKKDEGKKEVSKVKMSDYFRTLNG